MVDEEAARLSVRHLLGRLDALAIRVRAIVDRRRAADPSLDDPFLGLYLSDDKIDALLATSRADEEVPEADARRSAAEVDAGRGATPSRLMSLRERAGLDDIDEELLLVAAAPDIDERFEAFYGFLNDDVTRRRATIGLALRMAGLSPRSASARDRLRLGARLVQSGLVEIDDEGRPLLSRVLRVPDRVVAHLLGSDVPDPTLIDVLTPVHPVTTDRAGTISAAVRQGVDVLYLRTTSAGGAAELASAGCAREGRRAVCIDLTRLGSPERVAEVAVAAHREALLTGGVLVAGPVDELADDPAGLFHLRALADGAAVTVLHGTVSWDPRWSHSAGVVVEIPALGPDERRQLWSAASSEDLGVDPVLETVQFRLTPGQIAQTAEVARRHAALDDRPVGGEDLRLGARLQNASKLERLARRVEPAVGWDDLVLPDTTMRSLHRLADRARHRETVIDGWHMRPGGGRGRGITALFAGDSGTGKTMSAEVIAAELGLDLYVVNLATVVDKYVGETEKNLDRIFTEASGVNGVLLFDEADALFGQRSEVRDSHDRYANLEIAYLLQRMESFDGLAVLSTNLRANLDEAFARRLDAIVDYPNPGADARRVLWAKCLHTVPCAADLDVDFCAEAFDLTGGNIRSVAITAAYRAAASGGDVGMPMLIASIGEEYRKLGRLCLEAEFGHYHHMAAG